MSEIESGLNHLGDECGRLLQSVIDTQKSLIVVLHHDIPVLFNKAFQNFTGMATPREFLREFGSLLYRFVPHDSYFHAGKVQNPEEWTTEFTAIAEDDRIVSMIDCRAEPYAFLAAVETPVPGFTILSFTDISQDLIKRIMIENDVSIDKESGAYNQDYFTHTSKSFHEAAEFNKKTIAITMVELMSTDAEAEKYLREFTSSIKSSIRQSDMLVRWGKKVFLLAYLVDTADNAMRFSTKLMDVMRQEPFEDLSTINMRIGTTVQIEKEHITDIIARAQKALYQSGSSQITLL